MRYLTLLLLLLLAPSLAVAAPCETEPMAVIDSSHTALGGPFYECGPVAGAKAHSPTRMPHASRDLVGWVLCIEEFQEATWMFPDMDDGYIPWLSSEIEVYNQNVWPEGADIEFLNSHVRWTNVGPGRIGAGGEYLCAEGVEEIEVDGECLCPVPEPGFGDSLGVAMLMMGVRRRGRN